MTPKSKLLRKLMRQGKVCTRYYLIWGNNHECFKTRIALFKSDIANGFKYKIKYQTK